VRHWALVLSSEFALSCLLLAVRCLLVEDSGKWRDVSVWREAVLAFSSSLAPVGERVGELAAFGETLSGFLAFWLAGSLAGRQ